MLRQSILVQVAFASQSPCVIQAWTRSSGKELHLHGADADAKLYGVALVK